MVDFLKALLLSSASGTVIAILLFLLKPFLKNRISIKWQYYSWFLVFLRLLLPFTIGEGFIGKLIPAIQNPVVTAATSITPQTGANLTSTVSAVGSTVPAEVLKTINYGGLLIENLYPIVLSLWMLGMIMLLGINITGYLGYARRIKATRVPVTDKNTLELLNGCRKKLGLTGSLPLYVSSCTDTPMLCGLLRSSIIIPDRYFTSDQLRYIFLHELVHYRYRDNILKWVTVLTMSVHWFNPVVYLAVREISRQCELSCDETATSDFSKEERIDYGRTLLAVASKTEHRPFALSATMGEDKRNLKERLETLMKVKKINKRTLILSASVLAVVLVLTVLTIMLHGANKAPQVQHIGNGSDSSSDSSGSNIVYKNTQYGFLFTLPGSWKGYTIVNENWQGLDQNGKVVETGPIILIRSPHWTSENKYQDIPIMLISYEQIASYRSGILSFETFGSQYIIGNGSEYYFTIPSNYIDSKLLGYNEVEKILNSDCFQFSKENGYLVSPFMLSSAQKLDDNIHIINNVSGVLKSQFPDINITNEWIGDKCVEDRYMVLFGSLKSDSRQGVAQVIRYNPDCSKVLNQQRFLEPGKHGALKVIVIGSKDDNMTVVDADKNQRTFMYNVGFDLP